MSDSFAQRLIAWQKHAGRHDLPWQRTRDPYRIWLSEVMLQQTQVTTVVPYYLRFLERFPTVAALARADLGEVLALWSGLGYYRRAHLLYRAARVVENEHRGAFPGAPEELARLPGVGLSTANAIAAFAHGVHAPILEGNVKRVLARHEGIDGYPGQPAVSVRLWQLAHSLLPTSEIETYTQAMMDLGATVCIRRNPHCDACPVAEDCVARIERRVDALPAPRPRKVLPKRSATLLVIEQDDRVLLERRPPAGIWAGLWSLPEVGNGVDPGDYCRQRLGSALACVEALPAFTHTFTHFELTIFPKRCLVAPGARTAAEPSILWLDLRDTPSTALPAPIRKLLDSLAVLKKPFELV